MSIKFDRDTALDLIHTKLENLDIKINKILKKWGYSNIDDFIEDVKNGVIDDEGVDYAII